MSTILFLRGPRALSDFRLAKLNAMIAAAGARAQVHQVVFCHIVALGRPLDAAARGVLDRLRQP